MAFSVRFAANDVPKCLITSSGFPDSQRLTLDNPRYSKCLLVLKAFAKAIAPRAVAIFGWLESECPAGF